jgi:hypothetical protein
MGFAITAWRVFRAVYRDPIAVNKDFDASTVT